MPHPTDDREDLLSQMRKLRGDKKYIELLQLADIYLKMYPEPKDIYFADVLCYKSAALQYGKNYTESLALVINAIHLFPDVIAYWSRLAKVIKGLFDRKLLYEFYYALVGKCYEKLQTSKDAKVSDNLKEIELIWCNMRWGLSERSYMLPRCEYYTRYENSTMFSMTDYHYWNAYHRSERTRFFDCSTERKKRESSTYEVPGIYRPREQSNNSYAAHTGGYYNPYSDSSYTPIIAKQFPTTQLPSSSMYNMILTYEYKISKFIENRFHEEMKKQGHQCIQLTKENSSRRIYNLVRPMVFVENNYPCVLVSMPFINPGFIGRSPSSKEFKLDPRVEAFKFWGSSSGKAKIFQKLLMAYYVAIVDYNAERQGIPIELVMRASFGQLSPSVAETERSFRINVGIIPQEYAAILAISLVELYEVFNQLNDNSSSKWTPSTAQSDQIRSSPERVKKILAKPNLTYWQALRHPAHGRGDPILSELFREQINVELLANYVLQELRLSSTERNMERPISKMFANIHYISGKASYSQTTKDNYRSNHWPKWRWKKIKPIIDNDFWKTIRNISIALNMKEAFLQFQQLPNPIWYLYAFLESINLNFIRNYTVDDALSKNELGSDSEAEGDICEKKLYAKKITLTSGMMAIGCASEVAKYYLSEKHKGTPPYYITKNMMYYEIDDNFKYTHLSWQKNIMKGRILFFDLNYLNAKNLEQSTLEFELEKTTPHVIILDYTSATIDQINHALKLTFQQIKTKLVLLVSSGLKNEACGSDSNPYGTLRILSQNKRVCDDLYTDISKKLLQEASKPYLSPIAHRIRRTYKARGFVPKNSDILRGTIDELCTELKKTNLAVSTQNSVQVTPSVPIITTPSPQQYLWRTDIVFSTVQLENRSITFRKWQALGNGDCGFYALRLLPQAQLSQSRNFVIKQLNTRARDDIELRKIIAREIVVAFSLGENQNLSPTTIAALQGFRQMGEVYERDLASRIGIIKEKLRAIMPQVQAALTLDNEQFIRWLWLEKFEHSLELAQLRNELLTFVCYSFGNASDLMLGCASQAGVVTEFLNTYDFKNGEYLSFLCPPQAEAAQLQLTGIIGAIVYIRLVPGICIWEQKINENLVMIYRAGDIMHKETRHLLFDGNIHFDALIPDNPVNNLP